MVPLTSKISLLRIRPAAFLHNLVANLCSPNSCKDPEPRLTQKQRRQREPYLPLYSAQCYPPQAPRAGQALSSAAMLWLAVGTALLLTACVALYTVYTLPHWATRLAAWLNPGVLFFVDLKPAALPCPPGQRCKFLALTIDDSLDPNITQQAMELLRMHGARATFFIIGSHSDTAWGRGVLRDLVAQGHELGNHAWRDEPSWRLPLERLRDEVADVDVMIEAAHAAAGRPRARTKWFRPGSGLFTGRMLALMRALGYRTALGNVYPHDPQVSNWRLNSWMVLHRVQQGAVIILHDRRPWLIPTLREVLPRLAERGYQVVTLSELVAMGTGGAGGNLR